MRSCSISSRAQIPSISRPAFHHGSFVEMIFESYYRRIGDFHARDRATLHAAPTQRLLCPPTCYILQEHRANACTLWLMAKPSPNFLEHILLHSTEQQLFSSATIKANQDCRAINLCLVPSLELRRVSVFWGRVSIPSARLLSPRECRFSVCVRMMMKGAAVRNS